MVAITNTTSLTFLKEELDGTLSDAERHLEAWAQDHTRADALESCLEGLRQMAGIFRVLELPAATLMVDEMAALCGGLSDAPEGSEPAAVLGQALILLGRYLEYVQLKNQSLPEVLVAGINLLRRAAGKALIQESHFFALDLSRDRYPPAQATSTAREEVPRLCRRLRHMYQVGLIGVIRDDNSHTSLKLMARSLARIDRLSGDVPLGKLWWVGRAAVEAMIEDRMALTPARKALLGQLDRQIKRVIYEGEAALTAEVPLLLIKEACFVVSLSSQSAGVIGEVKQAYDLRPRLTDEYLQAEIALMSGGGGSVLRTVAASLKEELNGLKNSLDLAAQGVADADFKDVAENMVRVAGTLKMVKLDKESQQLKVRAEAISGWVVDQVDPEGMEFQALVDDLLMVENAVAALERTVAPADDVHKEAKNKSISLYQLDDARMAVVGECRSGLTLMKRAVTSYMDNNWDRMHLSNLPGTLASVSGGLVFLELDRAKGVIQAARDYIEQTLMGSDSETPEREHMDTLADAITAVDYYLESMEENKPIGESVLEVAEESMHELGYPVVRAAEL